jgi:hypothetical protein
MNRNSIMEEHDYEISFVEDVLGLAKTLMQAFMQAFMQVSLM